jgi:hypothetical protein
MFGDYISTSVPNGGNARPTIAVANAPTGTTFDLAMYQPTGGLAITGGSNTATAAVPEPAVVGPALPVTAH